jgi:hypothetical protein
MLFKRVHLFVGMIGVIVFLGTGLYMLLVLHGLQGVSALPRMLFRSSHIYILLTSFINLALGFYLPDSGRPSALRFTGSILILIAPVLMTLAFFIEPGLADFERPFAGPGVYSEKASDRLGIVALRER